MNSKISIILICTVAVCAARSTSAAPTPEHISSSWQLEFEFQDPQRLTLQLPGDKQPTTYWYVLYKVTNNTGKDVQFYPSFRLVTDSLKIVDGGADIHPRVYDTISARHTKEYPFFVTPSKTSGLLLQGKENARSSAVVFRMFDKQANNFTVYFSGLSGQIERVSNPTFDTSQKESTENQRFFLLRRTLAVSYDLPGDRGTRSVARPIRKHREWVMR